ncbi:hypothetical protein R1sor_008520 [Riccia sorocarpa]|uniref:Uncharacterized protein n=1 Tax=Riccia sorocarpa TaxID=122646 RepID=A0ABD3HVT5_9MARC
MVEYEEDSRGPHDSGPRKYPLGVEIKELVQSLPKEKSLGAGGTTKERFFCVGHS